MYIAEFAQRDGHSAIRWSCCSLSLWYNIKSIGIRVLPLVMVTTSIH